MCLVSKEKPVVKVTEDERVFYKVLATKTTRSWLNPGLFTPYMEDKVGLGVEYSMDDDQGFHEHQDKNNEFYIVGYGGYHVLENECDARYEVDYLSDAERECYDTLSGYRVFKAVVPKGTRYISGTYNGMKCAVVKKVRYEEI